MVRSKLLVGMLVIFLSLVMTACGGGGGGNTGGGDSAAKALIANRVQVIQTSSDIDTALSYMYDPLEIEMVATLDGKPVCETMGSPPECKDVVSEPVSHQDIRDMYAGIVTLEHNFERYDYTYTMSSRVVTVNGNTGTTTQTYSVSNYDILPEDDSNPVYDINGVYETFWTDVAGDWKMYKLRFTMHMTSK